MLTLNFPKTAFSALFIGLILSSNSFANEVNFNTTSHIVSIPKITVDNQATFSDIQLLLSPDGSWKILSSTDDFSTPDPADNSSSIAGKWSSKLVNDSFDDCDMLANLSINQNGQQLSGEWNADSNCFGSGSGLISGTISDNKANIRIYSGSLNINTTMTIADDFETITGSFVWSDLDIKETYSFTRQD